MHSESFLVEIGTEELPPKALLKLSEAFAAELVKGLLKANLSHDLVTPFATPRRLAVRIAKLTAQQQDQAIERRGPALQAAFDGIGKATKALEGFARSCGVAVADLETLETDKGSWLVYRSHQKGQETKNLLPALVETALAALPIPKRMRWGSLNIEFVRPVHWVVLLLGTEIIPADILGIRADRVTRGHRFHANDPITLARPEEYEHRLRNEGRVIASFDERKGIIRHQLAEAGKRLQGHVLIDEDLLQEVTGLVEWPVAVEGHFDAAFLKVPSEALISSMQGHQKYFPLLDDQQKLKPMFITIANIESKDVAQIRAGNERVIRPRLSDAAFFWDQDQKKTLVALRESLKSVVYQTKLGTLFEKTERLSRLASWLASEFGLAKQDLAFRAGELSKSDLLTNMVGEFPELQGIMGRYYAKANGEEDAVAIALDEQYRPRFSGDCLPESPTGQALALAEKMDTLVGIFGIGMPPTGDKDPFALRRAGLGVLRILIEQQLPLDLNKFIAHAIDQYQHQINKDGLNKQIFSFLMDRLKAYYQDSEHKPDCIEAVMAVEPASPLDFHQRVLAVSEFRERPEASSLAEANKRISNILRKSASEKESFSVTKAALREPQEITLHTLLFAKATTISTKIETGQYGAALSDLASFKQPVDDFFDKVMVMVEDETLRNNRLSLLKLLQSLFLQIADIGRLQ